MTNDEITDALGFDPCANLAEQTDEQRARAVAFAVGLASFAVNELAAALDRIAKLEARLASAEFASSGLEP